MGQKHVVQGRTLNVTNCKGENQGATGDVTGLTKLYVSDLRQHHTEQDLEVAFSRFGALREVVVMRHQETGEPRGPTRRPDIAFSLRRSSTRHAPFIQSRALNWSTSTQDSAS